MTLKYISGPTEIIRMQSKKYNRDIYLISDVHSTLKGMCKTKRNTREFHLYIDEIFKNNPNIQFDYFIEKGFVAENSIKIWSHLSYLSKTNSYFQDNGCFSIFKSDIKKCRKEYPNVRFHLGDTRNNIKYYKIERDNKFSFIVRYYFASKYDSIKVMKKHISEIKKFLLFIKYKKNLNMAYKELWESKLISSQYNKIKNKVIKRKIKKYFNNRWKTLLNGDLYKEYKNKINRCSMTDIPTLIIFNEANFSFFMIQVVSILMDLYLLSRLFKDFDNKPTKNIIIHAGEAHIKYYIDFLKTIDFELIESAKKTSERCLNVSKMKQPFFT